MRNSSKAAAAALFAFISVGGCGLDDTESQQLSVEESAIYGGTTDSNYKYPWVVNVCEGSIGLNCLNSVNVSCRGILIHPTYVLTLSACGLGPYTNKTVAFERTTSLGYVNGYRNSHLYSHGSWQGDLMILPLYNSQGYLESFNEPSVQPAQLPISSLSASLTGTVASGRPTLSTFNISTPSVTAVGLPNNEFTAASASSSLCSSDVGSGFVTQAGGVNFVRGIVKTTSGGCNANGASWTGISLREQVTWMRSTIGAPAPGAFKVAPADYDGDGKVDFAVKYDSGDWRIDLAANGFNGWDWSYPGYAGSTSTPVPADYDGDGKADLSVINGTTWYINYSGNGLADGIEVSLYNKIDSTRVPVPADYDGDGKADIATKGADGVWKIDLAADGFNGWNLSPGGYGNSSAVPVPADYDGDGKTDLSVKDGAGTWYVDYYANGFGWNVIVSGYGPSTSVPAPADYDGDGKADLSVKDSSGTWYFDYAGNGFGAWNNWRSGYGSGGQLLPRDYDGDGLADLSILYGTTWYIDYGASPWDGWNVMYTVTY